MNPFYLSFFFNISLTNCGLALPPETFIACPYEANILVSDLDTSKYFEVVIENSDVKLSSNWITGELFALLNEKNLEPIEMLGHVTSSYFSPNLNKSIALAIVKNGKKMKGQKLFVPMENKTINVTITDTVFLDKENKRLNA